MKQFFLDGGTSGKLESGSKLSMLSLVVCVFSREVDLLISNTKQNGPSL